MTSLINVPPFPGSRPPTIAYRNWIRAVINLASTSGVTPRRPLGLTGLVLPAAEYLPLNAGQPYAPLASPQIPIAGTTAVELAIFKLQDEAALYEFSATGTLKNTIYSSLDPAARKVVSDAEGSIRAVTIPMMLERMRTRYGTLSNAYINELKSQLNSHVFAPPEDFSDFITRSVETHDLLAIAGFAINDFDKTEALHRAVIPCALFTFTLANFYATYPNPTLQTFANLSTSLIQASQIQPLTTSAGAGYAHEASSAAVALSSEALIAQLRAENTSLKAAAAGKKKSTTSHTNYCWSHGFVGHIGTKCNNKKPGHQDSATAANHMGGSAHTVYK